MDFLSRKRPDVSFCDFFFNCPVLEPQLDIQVPPDAESYIEGKVREYDVIVVTQSCDLEKGKIETVLVCPVISIDKFDQSKDNKEKIRRGFMPGYHMLNSCALDGFTSPIKIVSIRQVFGLPFDYIQNMASHSRPRLRLLPPYREHLAQAFARFIMRIGLPNDIPPIK